jgi:hypothetical protein
MSSDPARSCSIAIFRTRVFGASDLDNVKKV